MRGVDRQPTQPLPSIASKTACSTASRLLSTSLFQNRSKHRWHAYGAVEDH
jgi:hypothetical protein